MRFIHTADWHLGNVMHEIDRKEETIGFLRWLKEQIQEKDIDTLIVSGDIFDVTNPTNSAKSIYYRFLASLLDTNCQNVIIIGGNHDSAALLDAPKDLLDALNITVVGSITGCTPDMLVRELTDAKGDVIGICAAVPYAREAELREYVTDAEAVFADNAYKGLYSAVYQAAERLRGSRELPIIATGHLYAAGIEGRPEHDDGEGLKDHGIRNIVGNLGTVSASVFPAGFDYVALGHIHYASMVAKNAHIRYSGSPFVLGFDECSIPHYVIVAEAEYGEELHLEKLVVPQYFRFIRVEGDIDTIMERLAKLDEELRENESKPVKVEIVYEYKIGRYIRDELKDILDNAAFEVVSWKALTGRALSATELSDEYLDDVSQIGEEEVFRRLILKSTGKEKPDEETEKLYEEYWPMFKLLLEEE